MWKPYKQLPEQLVDEHAGEDADEDADHRQAKEGTEAGVEDAVDDLAVGSASEDESQSGWKKIVNKLNYFHSFAALACRQTRYSMTFLYLVFLTRMLLVFFLFKLCSLALFDPSLFLTEKYFSLLGFEPRVHFEECVLDHLATSRSC